MNGSRIHGAVLLIVASVVLGGCAAGPNNVADVDAQYIAGFWLGLWHGVISPITFLISLFTDKVSVYEVHNNGNWYDFGFILGVCLAFGGAARSGTAPYRRKGRK
ncbi:MAG: hypothetical protein ACRDT8_03285 [Micromonosporaceae bacterium]